MQQTIMLTLVGELFAPTFRCNTTYLAALSNELDSGGRGEDIAHFSAPSE